MVTSSVRMLDWVHGDTSNSWPVVSLGFSLEPGVGGLQKGLVDPLSPIFPSQLDTMVPSGMALTGRMLPMDNEAL